MDIIRKEAYEIIRKVFLKNIFSDKLLTKIRSKYSKQQIDFIYRLVKGTIKYKNSLDYIIQNLTDKKKYQSTDLSIKLLLYFGLYQLKYMDSIPEFAAINETVELAKDVFNENIAKFINAVLREYQRNPEINYPKELLKYLSVKYSFPEELIKIWIDYWGKEDTELLCMFFNEPANLHLRVNQIATSPEKLIAYFKKRDIDIVQSIASSNMLISNEPDKILNDVSFEEGYFSIQDTSAALVVELLKPKVGESILDFFAAPGGKASYIAEMMQNEGEIVAVEKMPVKTKLIKKLVSRLGITNMLFYTGDALKYKPIAPCFDRVLLDVPCSGWGVLKKKAELRWQINQDIKELLKLQYSSLIYAKKFVKPNGYIVYSTCTLNKEENENQIEKFLAKNKDFRLVDARNFISNKYCEGKYLKTIPFKNEMDGAFAAKLKKVKD